MEKTRVILVGIPRMLSGIITELVSGEPDLTIVGDLDDSDTALKQIKRSSADVVVTGSTGSVRANVSFLLGECRGLRILSVTDDGRESFLYELLLQERLLGEISPQMLLEALSGRRPIYSASEMYGSPRLI